jgi:hypothetical protein
MLKIEQLNLNLPIAYQVDARNIAQGVIEQLSQFDHSKVQDRPSISVSPLYIRDDTDSHEVAILIADHIYKTLGGGA